MRRPETMLVMGDDVFRQLFDEARMRRLAECASLSDVVHTSQLDTPEAQARLAEVEVLITGWDCPPLTAELLASAPRLRAVFHAAGTVKGHITNACWDRGIIVTTAAEANAIPVAEYTLAAVIFAGKGVLPAAAANRERRGTTIPRDWPGSNLERTVGIVGFSRIGRRVVDLLRSHDHEVLVSDPIPDPTEVSRHGGELVDLADLLERSDIVSLHAPLLPNTRHLLDEENLGRLRPGATLINTARGALVDTDALTALCETGHLSAILDVTEPEPLPADSPLWELPNVILTPHIAGAKGAELHRLCDAALDELELFARGKKARDPVSPYDLERIA